VLITAFRPRINEFRPKKIHFHPRIIAFTQSIQTLVEWVFLENMTNVIQCNSKKNPGKDPDFLFMKRRVESGEWRVGSGGEV
jgi:hypothetical protein